MTLSDGEIFSRIKQLIQTVPQQSVAEDIVLEWSVKADVLVELAGNDGDNDLVSEGIYDIQRGYIEDERRSILEGIVSLKTVLIRCMYRLELKGKVDGASSFVPAGKELDALAAIKRVFFRAKQKLYLIDPYVDETLFTDFLRVEDEKLRIQILSCSRNIEQKVRVPLNRWCAQYPLNKIEVRTCDRKLLHDRLMIVDDDEVWLMSQSFNGFAKRSHAYLQRADEELSPLKKEAYSALWDCAEVF